MLNCLRRPVILAIVILSLADSLAFAGWKASIVGRCDSGVLAIDSGGTTHLVCSRILSTGAELFYYVTYGPNGRRGPLLATRPPLPSPRNLTIATDSHNRPHVALIGGTGQLAYLDFDGHGWHSQRLDPDLGYSTNLDLPLILDSNGNPHLAYVASNGFLTHAYFDGTTWQFEHTGASVMPTAIQIAKDGTVHIVGIGSENSQVCEERGLKGSWTGECFDNSGPGYPALALAADGTPKVVYGSRDQTYFDTIKVAHFDGATWSIESTFDTKAFGLVLVAATAIDSSGMAKIIFEGEDDNLYYVAQVGDTWALTNLGSVGILQTYLLSLQLDSIGLPHATFWTNDVFNFQIYAALTLPVLTVQWQRVATRAAAGKTVITGKLLVSNIGTAPTSGYNINYYLSTDNQLDPSDTLLGNAKLALGAGQHNVATFNFSHSGAVSGEYLIAAITPNNSLGVVDSGNSVAAAFIP